MTGPKVRIVARSIEGGQVRADVEIIDEASKSHHAVSCGSDYCERVAPGIPVSQLIEASFLFLLDREPKESILARFDLSVIEQYFPQYRQQVNGYLGGPGVG